MFPTNKILRTVSYSFYIGLSFTTWTSRIAYIQLNSTDGQLSSVLLAMPVGLWISLAVSGWFVKKYLSKPIAVLGDFRPQITLVAIGLCSTTKQLVITIFLSDYFIVP